MYVYEMLGAELLSNLYDRLGRQLIDPQQSAVWQVTTWTRTVFWLRFSCRITVMTNVFSSTIMSSLKDTEALLFGFQSIAETIDVNYSDVIPGLIGLIPRINISNIMLADTVMYTIGIYTRLTYSSWLHDCVSLQHAPCRPGSLAEWLADHPVMLSGILPMVLQGLVKAELSVSSVSTLKRICRECRHDLAPFAQDILTVSQVGQLFTGFRRRCICL